MKRFSWFRKRPSVVGISESDYVKIYNAINEQINQAKARQKNPESGPNQYMQGLNKALNILDSIRPYKLTEV